jgi:5-oxopent-3-ene-1,2,5-tricarboxylate decarboxylase / 2-hydroxyhepta-2,4-diene-1,7-dioate isomerase
MIFDIPTLIEYLTSFMTLNPGDVILTGTPEGLADVKAGDVIETEVEGSVAWSTPSSTTRPYFATE